MCVSLQSAMSRRRLEAARTLGRPTEGVRDREMQSAAGSQWLWKENNQQQEIKYPSRLIIAARGSGGPVQKLWCFKEQTEGYFEITTAIKHV